MIAAAAVVTAGVTLAMMVVVIALHIGIKAKCASQQVGNCCICITAAAAVQCDACLCQCHLCAAANTAADQHICMQGAQHACQRAVTAAVGIHYFGCNHSTILHFIDLKLLGVTEMLEDLTVSISNCDSHNTFAPLKLRYILL